MGGQVAIGVRLTHEDKTIVREVYTSGISNLFDAMDFYDEEIFHIQANLLHKYAEKIPFAPSGYGLVFGDYQKKKIHSMQGYTSVGRFGSSGICLSIDGNMVGGEQRDLPHERLKEFVHSGLVSMREWKYYSTADTGSYTTPIPISDWDKVVELCMAKDLPMGLEFIVDIDGWEIINYGEDLDGVLLMFKMMLAHGFEFSDEDIEAWDAFVEEREMIDDYLENCE